MDANKETSAVDNIDFSAITSLSFGKGWRDVVLIVIVAVVVLVGIQLAIEFFKIPTYILPTPTEVAKALFTDFPTLSKDLLITLYELVTGYLIGGGIGLVLAAVVTQIPLVEKIITPYIIILVTTPMIALVPLLVLRFGFGSEPRIIAVALAAGPMIMVNAATGFKRVDATKIALARSYGASLLQIFLKIRFPMAMPMIVVGMTVGGILGLITAVGAEMIAGQNGLGNKLGYYSSLMQMPQFFATIVLIMAVGLALYILMYLIGKKYSSWQE